MCVFKNITIIVIFSGELQEQEAIQQKKKKKKNTKQCITVEVRQ